ncbi:phosphoserine phosphatase SerB [Niveibacterium sp. 24ML]|uniref:phosphoserine phosphatase SerB n=1 Tax=Niveibacterium sp. 24ML TaxID=2985512 RepID=UPI0022720E0E|nr:phosphoserine phosphatase SerB [Niveibacterium sp. 24ML]MCX9156685.1 phosphoserine phosphatase SerB [Niveibacterium sp. 24ML]
MSEFLVVQGRDIATPALKRIAHLTGAAGIEQIHTDAFRLLGAARHSELAEHCAAAQADFGWVPAGRQLGDYGLFVTDMDSTLITIECIDEIADMIGVKPQVSEITEAAMRGEIDFAESLTRRVSLLAGLEESALDRVYAERLALNPGAEALMKRLQAAGLRTVLVSGGFTFFTDRLRTRLGFDHSFANVLETHGGRLTGRVEGPIIDAAAKRKALESLRDQYGIAPSATLAAGDGANDLEMFSAAGLSFAFRAKPVVRAQASYALDFAGLDGILPFVSAN